LGEILVLPELGGVKIEATLASWDAVSAKSALALAEFLVTAQCGLRCARSELGAQRATVVCQIRTEDFDFHLVHGVRGVAAGARTLAREARALLVPELANIYLEVLARPGQGRPAIAAVDDRAGAIPWSQSFPSKVTQGEGG
jgi:hypothetical protein